MDISRPTVTRIYNSARQKIADALVNGRSITISGGDVTVCEAIRPECVNEKYCCHRQLEEEAVHKRKKDTIHKPILKTGEIKMKVLIVGGVAAGTKTAAKLKREDRNAEVVVITKDKDISYAGCGLPYYVGG